MDLASPFAPTHILHNARPPWDLHSWPFQNSCSEVSAIGRSVCLIPALLTAWSRRPNSLTLSLMASCTWSTWVRSGTTDRKLTLGKSWCMTFSLSAIASGEMATQSSNFRDTIARELYDRGRPRVHPAPVTNITLLYTFLNHWSWKFCMAVTSSPMMEIHCLYQRM